MPPTQVPIGGLRHEQIRRCRGDPCDAGDDAVPAPEVVSRRRGVAREGRVQYGRLPPAMRTIAMRRSGSANAVAPRRSATARPGSGTVPNASATASAAPSPATPISRESASRDRHFRSQDVRRKAPADRFGEIRGDEQRDRRLAFLDRGAPQHAVREHASLRRVVAPVLALARRERADVARQLRVQERDRVVAGHPQCGPAGGIAGDGGRRLLIGGATLRRSRRPACGRPCRARRSRCAMLE